MPALHVPLGVGDDVLDDVVKVVVVVFEVVTTVVLRVLEDFVCDVVEVAVEVVLVGLVVEAVEELGLEVVDVACPELTVMAGVEVGVIGTVPSEGVAEHVVTWRPAVSELSASGCS